MNMRASRSALPLIGLVALGLSLRLPGLGRVPLHQDEGLNGWLTLLVHWWGRFEYQPSDNHGPFLYYAGALFFRLLGPSEFSLRLAPALAGALIPLGLLPARRWFPGGGLLFAGLLFAVAPALVYFSRAAIHEIHLVFFSALLAASLARFAARPSRGWAAACGAAAAVCFATKETALLTAASLGVGALAGGAAWLAAQPSGWRWEGLRARGLEAVRAAPVGLLVFAAGITLLYSAFFTSAAGLRGFFEAFGYWFEYGVTGRNQPKPFGYFWELMAYSEGACRWLVLPAAALAVLRRSPAGHALTGWALAAFGIYSSIRYKTPWCVLQIDLPVFALIGWAAGHCWSIARDRSSSITLRAAAALGVGAALLPAVGMLYRSVEDVRDRYDDPALPYVYNHTMRSYFALLQDLFGVADAAPGADGRGLRNVNSEAPDPVRWYLYTRGWDLARERYRDNPPPPLDWLQHAEVVITSPRHLPEIRNALPTTGAAWHEESYPTRPGVATTVFYRQELWDRYQAAGGRAVSPWPRPAVDAPAPPEPEDGR
jgi:uncharacterized protein (TIGR03663 family)